MQMLKKSYPLILKNDYIGIFSFHLQAYTKQINQEYSGISPMESLELEKNKEKTIQVYCLEFFFLFHRLYLLSYFTIIQDCKDNQQYEFCMQYASLTVFKKDKYGGIGN